MKLGLSFAGHFKQGSNCCLFFYVKVPTGWKPGTRSGALLGLDTSIRVHWLEVTGLHQDLVERRHARVTRLEGQWAFGRVNYLYRMLAPATNIIDR